MDRILWLCDTGDSDGGSTVAELANCLLQPNPILPHYDNLPPRRFLITQPLYRTRSTTNYSVQVADVNGTVKLPLLKDEIKLTVAKI